MENFDLIMAGSGFASSFFLKKYLEKSAGNKKVLVLERGVLFPYAERLKIERGEPSKFSPSLSDPAKTFKNDSDKVWIFDPNFGGSSNCWTACTPRFLPNDFKIKTRYGVGQDWPLSYNDIEPYYCDVEDIMMIAGPDITPFPKSRPYPLPPQKLSTADKLIQAKYKELYISQPTGRPTAATNGKRGICCNSAVCKLCPVNSKFTVENTLADIYKDPRVTIKYNCQVFSLSAAGNTIKSVSYSHEGKTYEVKSNIIALGANPIFNAHILLNTGDTNKFTGKGLCEQRGTFAYLYFDKLDNVGGGSIISANGFMLYDGDHRKNYAACLIESFNDPYIRNEFGKWRKIAKLKFIFEDLPSDNNKVVLTDNILKPETIYTGHSDYVDKAMEKLNENIHKTFSFLPLEKIEMDGFFQQSEFHICSTTRMSSTADEGVVDKNLIHHQYRNLFVLGSSVFPSITPANPTLTLSALSLRAADKSF